MTAPAPGMFTLPTSGVHVWVGADGRVYTVHRGRIQRNVIAKWESGSGFVVTGNGEPYRALLLRWSARPDATRLDFSGPCPVCARWVGNLREHVCKRIRGAA